jgi:Asp/Glu/hydantoin racemase
MIQKICVINPNSLDAVTEGIDAALQPLRRPDGPILDCMTLAEGPPGIQTQQDADAAVGPLIRTVTSLAQSASAFVIACFSDPGLHSLREITTSPVIGIGEAGMLTALTLGQRVGVIAILAVSIPRHLRYYGAMGIRDRVAAELAIDMPVAALADRRRTLARMIDVGNTLRDGHGADVLVMACAGMAALRAELQHEVGVPVVEPCQAGVATAIARVQLNWHGA